MKEKENKTKSQNSQKNVKKSEKSQKNAKKTTKKVEKKPKNIKIAGFHDLALNTYIFDEVSSPKAVVVIVHGMQEHCLRYSDFAHFLNKHGYIVVASDLRGHGRTMATKEDYGRGEQDIFTETIKDQLNILNYINEKFNLPIYVFGHSYGSMLTQVLIQQTSLIEKAVICGTTNGSCAQFHMGSCAITVLSPFKKKDQRGGIEEKLCLRVFEKKFERGNWFSRDEESFDKYLKDEFCGGSFPFSFYRSLIKNMTKANKGMNKIGSKKLFLISGDNDPLSNGGKKVLKLYKIYLRNNIDVKMKLYKGARHELINETNKAEVYQDILNFYDN